MAVFEVTFQKAEDESPAVEAPGEAMAKRLAEQMGQAGLSATTIDLHENYGWFWLATFEGATYHVLLAGNYGGNPGDWIVTMQPRFGLATVFKKRRYEKAAEKLKETLGRLLSEYPGVSKVSWKQAVG